MKKYAFIALWVIIASSAWASDTVHVVYPDSFPTVNHWKRKGQYHWIAQFDNPLYVIGYATDKAHAQVYLAAERYRVPEEMISGFETDSTSYDSITLAHRTERILLTLDTNYMHNYDIRLGSTITNLTAEIAGQRKLKVWDSTATMTGNIFFEHHRPDTLPDLRGARLSVCMQNVKNYFVYYNNPYAGPETWAEMDCQLQKIASSLVFINADIFALCEVERSDAALDSLVNRMNRLVGETRYGYVEEDNAVRTMKNYPLLKDSATYTRVCFIYNQHKCSPISNYTIGRPYLPNGNKDSQRYSVLMEYVKFKELATNGTFILSMNHFRAKTGTLQDRMENSEQLVASLNANIGTTAFNDSDVLIVGDLNSYTYEQPCLYLREHGYIDEIMRFSPNEYSHTYANQVGYLDHVFSSSSMSEQITWAGPYHINADEPSSSSYTQGDCSRFGYSDHDPILIGIVLKEQPTALDTPAKKEQIIINGQTAHITYPGQADILISNVLGQSIVHSHFTDEIHIALPSGLVLISVNGKTQKMVVYPAQ